MAVIAPRRTGAKESLATWRLGDRIALGACWACGIGLCLIAGAILVYMLVRGVQYAHPSLLWERPVSGADQHGSGGFLDPLVGTLLLTIMGTLMALPLGVAVAIWTVEYGRPSWLARMVESGVEVVAGTPSIVLAIFGLLLFQQPFLGFLSFHAAGGAVFGRSFFAAGTMMSLLAMPLVFTATREALQSIPRHVREASFALGKTRWATIRRVLLPAARPGIATGAALGMGRIAGDTAIVVILLGATLQLQGAGGPPGVSTLRGTGSPLTSYVYNNSPAGEGNAAEKAYAAAFVLLVIVVLINLAIDRISNRRSALSWKT
ncbi:MAG: phosphate transport system permease protein [Solirubrobacteraceae bacterium]|nr:phosphate transport system permease protein [Solirubrobacteraceae bacterium]